MIGLLRFVGVFNAAVWFGMAVFFTFAAGLAPFSEEMRDLLGPKNYPYFSGAIAQIVIARYFAWQMGCAVIAVLHLLAEKFYYGRPFQRVAVGLMVGLCSLVLVGGWGLQPKLKRLHLTQYAVNVTPEQHAAAHRSFRLWHGVSQGVNLLVLGGLAFYLWRVANPPDATRFVSTSKFRG